MLPKTVRVEAYVCKGADVSGNRIQEDIKNANAVWEACEIKFILTATHTVNDNSLEYKDREFICGGGGYIEFWI